MLSQFAGRTNSGHSVSSWTNLHLLPTKKNKPELEESHCTQPISWPCSILDKIMNRFRLDIQESFRYLISRLNTFSGYSPWYLQTLRSSLLYLLALSLPHFPTHADLLCENDVGVTALDLGKE